MECMELWLDAVAGEEKEVLAEEVVAITCVSLLVVVYCLRQT